MVECQESPQEYQPFHEVDICGNSFVDVTHVLEIEGKEPFLIGKGELPNIWLYAPPQAEAGRWMPLVEGNLSGNPLVTVIKKKSDEAQIVEVQTSGKVVLRVKMQSMDMDKVVVEVLDLRPIGLNVHGDHRGLTVGSNTFSGNRFMDLETGIAVA